MANREQDYTGGNGVSKVRVLDSAGASNAEPLASFTGIVADGIPFVGENLCMGSAQTYTHGVQGALTWLPIPKKLTIGETYSVSALIETASGGTLVLVLTDTPGGYANQQQIDNNSAFVAQYESGALLAYQSSTSGSTSVSHVKLETGPKITPWCPNPNDIAVNIDTASTSEQMVPGMYALGVDGAKKQVYARGFSFENTLNNSGEADTVLASGAQMSVISSRGHIRLISPGIDIPIPYAYLGSQLTFQGLDTATVYGDRANGRILLHVLIPGAQNANYSASGAVYYIYD